MPTFGRGILSACFLVQIATESERCHFGSCFSVALLVSLVDFATEIHFGREKAEHANAPNGTEYWEACTVHARAASGGVQGRKDGRPGGGVQRG